VNYKEKMFNTTIIYFIGQMGAKVLSFLLLPLYTNYISKDAYGYFDIMQVYLGIAIPVIFMEIWSGILRFSVEKREREGLENVYSNAIALSAGLFCVFTAAYLIANHFLHFQYSGYIYLYAVVWLLDLILKSQCRGLGYNRVYAVSGMITTFLVAALSILCVFVFHMDIETLFLSNIIGFFVNDLYLVARTKIYRYLKIRQINREMLMTLLKFCLPLSINSVFYWILNSVNRVIIVNYLGVDANGSYAVANKLGTIITVFVSIAMLSWQETIFSAKREDLQKIYNESFHQISHILLYGSLVLIPLTALVFNIFIGQEYRDIYALTLLMYFSVFVTSLNSFIDVLFSAIKKTDLLMVEKVVGGVINLGVMFFSIRTYGLYSSPVAIIFAQIACIVINVILLRKYIMIRIPVSFMVKSLVGFAVLSVCYLAKNYWFNGAALLLTGGVAVFELKDFLLGCLGMLKGKLKRRAS